MSGKSIQKTVFDLSVGYFGSAAARPDERGARCMEETCEAAQCAGLPEHVALRIVRTVYSRPSGELHREIGQMWITWLGLAESMGLDTSKLVLEELKAFNHADPEKLRRRHAEKVALGISIADENGTYPGGIGRATMEDKR